MDFVSNGQPSILDLFVFLDGNKELTLGFYQWKNNGFAPLAMPQPGQSVHLKEVEKISH